jgi:starch phosphorylase
MREACGDENIFIFGLTTKEVDRLWKQGYNASSFYADNIKLEKVIKALNAGFNGQSFSDIANYLLTGSPIADPYMCLADFGSFCDIHAKADEVYGDKLLWAKKSLNNIATAGIFASDRSIREYADRIWGLKKIK